MNEHIIPLDLQLAEKQHSLDENKINFDKNRNLSDLLNEIQQKCIREIYETLGSKAQDYIMFRKKARDIAKSKRPLFTATPKGRKIKNQFQKTRLAESNEYIKKLGINHGDFKSILRKYQEESKLVIEKIRAPETLLDVGPISPEILEPDRPWTYIYPPYDNSSSDHYISHCGSGIFIPHVFHSENHLTGELSLFTQHGVIDPGDSSFGVIAATNGIQSYFQMPTAGRLNVWSYLECVESSYWGSLSNEWGWSDASVQQLSECSMSVGSPPNYSVANFALLDYFRGEKEGEWSGNMAQPGEFKYCNVTSDQSFSVGQGVIMRTGITDIQDMKVDDMDLVIDISNKWILRKIAIAVIP
jgi:hypothetical protein